MYDSIAKEKSGVKNVKCKSNRFQNDIKGDGGVDGQRKECQHTVP